MKHAIVALFAALTLVCSVAKADVLLGYDGDCTMYFRPDYGYFEVCENREPVFLGVEFDTYRFHRGFRESSGFREHFGRAWSGPRVRYQSQETTTVHRKGR